MNLYRAAERNRQEVDGPTGRVTRPSSRADQSGSGRVRSGSIEGRDVSRVVWGSRWSIGATEPTSELPGAGPPFAGPQLS